VCAAQDVYCKFKGSKLQLLEHEFYCKLLKHQNILLPFKQELTNYFESKIAELKVEIASLKGKVNNNSLITENLALNDIILNESPSVDTKLLTCDDSKENWKINSSYTPTQPQTLPNKITLPTNISKINKNKDNDTQLQEIKLKEGNTIGAKKYIEFSEDHSDDCDVVPSQKKTTYKSCNTYE